MPIDQQSRWYNPVADDTAVSGIAAGTVITASGNSPAFSITDQDILVATLNVTAITGTGASLTVALQVTEDGTNWLSVGVPFPALTAPGTAQDVFSIEQWNQGRWVYTVAGTTPSITIGITTTKKYTGQA